MKIQIASDLHLEHTTRYFNGHLLDFHGDADVLVLAGDIHSGHEAFRVFSKARPRVIYVMGNHEFYGKDIDRTRHDAAQAARESGVDLLDNSEVVIDGVRLLGCTLWTNFKIEGTDQRVSMSEVSRCLNDFRIIRNGYLPFTVGNSLREFEASIEWLKGKFDEPFDGKTVVITHHGVHPQSISPGYKGNPINGAFVSDLGKLLQKADLWIHGHVHSSHDYTIGRARVVANPQGYVLNLRSALHPADFILENPDFKSDCIVEI